MNKLNKTFIRQRIQNKKYKIIYTSNQWNILMCPSKEPIRPYFKNLSQGKHILVTPHQSGAYEEKCVIGN